MKCLRIETILCFYCAVVCLVVWRLATNTRIAGTIVAWSEALHVPNEQEMSSLLFTEGKPLSLKICVKILNNQTIIVNRVFHSKANCLVLPGGESYMEQTGMLVGNFEFNP